MQRSNRRWLAAVIAVALLATGHAVPTAHADGCSFVLGFATLEQMIPQQVGQCREEEQHNPANGDGLQHTSGGLLVWRKSDNWTAFTDGYHTWINGPHGLEERLNTQRFAWEANPDGLPVVADAPVPLQPLPNPDLHAILFVDGQHGWAAGSQRIVATIDGGATWTTQYTGPEVFAQLDFLNADDGWALGQHTLLHTADGGQTWLPFGEPPQPLDQMHFLSPTSGYGVADGALYRTADAGTTWQPLATPIAVGGLCFVSVDTGWVVNTSPFQSNGRQAPPPSPTALYATTDAGANWRQVALPAAMTSEGDLGQRLQCAPRGVLWDLFLGGVGAGNQFYALYRGSASGAPWQLLTGHELSGGLGPDPGSYAGALSVVDADAAYLTGVCFACYPPSPTTPPAVAIGGTTDAGHTWHVFPVPGLPPTTNDIAFISSNQGWLVAEGSAVRPSQILVTVDGGRTWTQQFVLSSSP